MDNVSKQRRLDINSKLLWFAQCELGSFSLASDGLTLTQIVKANSTLVELVSFTILSLFDENILIFVLISNRILLTEIVVR